MIKELRFTDIKSSFVVQLYYETSLLLGIEGGHMKLDMNLDRVEVWATKGN
jgi:hypothetical protein